MFSKIIELWLEHIISPLKKLAEGINSTADIYDYIENVLKIPSPYSTYFLFAVIAVLIVGLFLLFGYIFYGADNRIRRPPKK